jgi:hypothetical protein
MRKILTVALAALTLGGAVAAAATPAAARPHGGWGGHGYYGGGRYYGHRGSVAGPAIAAGVVGLALGAALASNSRPAYGYYDSDYPRYGYGYAPGYYGYGGGYCESRRWVYDPYIGRRVMVRSSYAC